MESVFERFRSSERLCIMYTMRCNLTCSHCLLDCHPRRQEKLSVELCTAVLDVARQYGKRCLNLSGGEVFLYYPELLEIVRYAGDLGMEVDIETNGFWARSDAECAEKLRALKEAGLATIYVSIDTYHIRFIPLDVLIRLVGHCRLHEIHCEVTFTPSDDRETDEMILSRLAAEQIGYFEEPLLNLGRACTSGLGMLGPRDLYPCDSFCTTIHSSGDAFVCCSFGSDTSAMKETPVFLGNVFHDPIAVLFERDREWGRRIEAFWRPDTEISYQKLAEAFALHRETGGRYRSICDFCCHALKDRRVLDQIRRHG